ncbi:hypothetical protein B4079_5177 [Bacillus cereus]|nr:hypothetical protein B4079_5177 [Bacillus cereus]
MPLHFLKWHFSFLDYLLYISSILQELKNKNFLLLFFL